MKILFLMLMVLSAAYSCKTTNETQIKDDQVKIQSTPEKMVVNDPERQKIKYSPNVDQALVPGSADVDYDTAAQGTMATLTVNKQPNVFCYSFEEIRPLIEVMVFETKDPNYRFVAQIRHNAQNPLC